MRATTSSGRAARSTSRLGPEDTVRHGIRPNQRRDMRPPIASSANPPAANSGVSSNGSVLTTSRLLDVVVDPAQVGLVGRRVVRAVGLLGDVLEDGLVELGVDPEAVDLERRAGRRADADRVDPDAPVLAAWVAPRRVRGDGVLAVAEQDDDGRLVDAGRDRRRRAASAPASRVRVVVGRRADVARGR